MSITGIAPDGWEIEVEDAGYTPSICNTCRRTIWHGHGLTLEACDDVRALERNALYGAWPLVYDNHAASVLVDDGLPSEGRLDANRLWFTEHIHTDVVVDTTTDPAQVTNHRVLDPAMLDRPAHYELCPVCWTVIMWDDATLRAYDAMPLRRDEIQQGMRVAALRKRFGRRSFWLQYLDLDHGRLRGDFCYRMHTHEEA